MKNIKILSFITIFFLILNFLNCSKKEFGEKIEIPKFTPIEQLVKFPQNYLNKQLKIKGTVVEQGYRTAWIIVKGKQRAVTVMLDKFFKLPNLMNKNVIVVGTFTKRDEGIVFIGRWLKIE